MRPNTPEPMIFIGTTNYFATLKQKTGYLTRLSSSEIPTAIRVTAHFSYAVYLSPFALLPVGPRITLNYALPSKTHGFLLLSFDIQSRILSFSVKFQHTPNSSLCFLEYYHHADQRPLLQLY